MNFTIPFLTSQDFDETLRTTTTALLPIGSIEQHGPHLPSSTDAIIIEYISKLVAEKLGSFLLPVIPFGVSFEHAPMLNISIRNQTLSRLVGDICVSLSENGIREIVIFNGHHGNVGSLQYVFHNIIKRINSDTRVHTLHYWHFIETEFDHAGMAETSMMLAIMPLLVQMSKAEPNSKKLIGPRSVYATLTNEPGSFPLLTGNGVWGDPRKATENFGKELITNAVQGLTSTIRDLEEYRR